MSLQDTFYIVSIVFMSLYTLFLLAIIILLIYLTKKVIQLYETLTFYIKHPTETAVRIGSKLAVKAWDKVTKTKAEKTR
jgi:hypothetical protein